MSEDLQPGAAGAPAPTEEPLDRGATTLESFDNYSASTASWLAKHPVGQLVDGREIAGDGDPFVVDDPGRGAKLVELSSASTAQVDAAVAAARTAFADGPWSRTSPDERERLLRTLADLVERDRRLLAELEVLETGKPLSEALACADEVASVVRYYAGWANKVVGSVIAAPPKFHAFTTPVPLGVCAAITPWNYPISILSYKLAPALATGNTLIVKPSELAPLGTLHIARLVAEAGIPDGVVNVVTGARNVGAALASHTGLDKLAFTGSTTTGRKVMQAATARPARVSLELGGKSAHIVFPDADLDQAAEVVCEGIFTNAGQVCVAGSRLLVHRDIHDAFVVAVASRAKAVRVGHGLDPAAQMGPVITDRQRQTIIARLDEAEHDGATVVTGAKPTSEPGYFLEPSVVTNLDPQSWLAQNELFGPVLGVLTFTSDAEAVRIANDTPYGLAAGLWTNDLRRAHAVNRQLEAGSVWVNTYGVFHPTLPFGGVRGSGFGRELGAGAIEHYTETKTTVIGI
ncbi:aldehyde dehydrogenase family protein [Nocardioides hungaricus]